MAAPILAGLFLLGRTLVRAASPAIASAIRSQGGRVVKKLTKALTKKYGQPKTMSKPPKITAKLGQNKTTGTSVTKPSGGSSSRVTKPNSTSVTKSNKTPKKKVFEGEVIPPKKNVSTKVNTPKRKGETIEGTTNKPLKVGGASKLKTLASVTAQIAADKIGTKSGVKSTNLSAEKSKKTSVNKTPNYAGSRGIPKKKTPDYAGSRGIPKKSAVDTSKIKKPKKTEKVKREVLKKTKEKNYTGKFVNEKGEVAYDSIGDFFSNMAGTAKKREAPKDRKKIKSAKKGATKGVGFSGKSVAKPFSKKKK
jgi:hypothetical protein